MDTDTDIDLAAEVHGEADSIGLADFRIECAERWPLSHLAELLGVSRAAVREEALTLLAALDEGRVELRRA